MLRGPYQGPMDCRDPRSPTDARDKKIPVHSGDHGDSMNYLEDCRDPSDHKNPIVPSLMTLVTPGNPGI